MAATGQPAIAQPVQPGQPAPAIAQPATASVWQQAVDDNGNTYYHNTETGTTQWERPSEAEMTRAVPTLAATSVVMGIPIDDPELAPVIRRVMILSGLSAFLIVADGVLSLVATGDAWFLLLGLCMLLIPTCGYCGALKKSRDFMCCFCGWSFACFLLTFANLIIIVTFTVKEQLPNEETTTTILVFSLIINTFSSLLYFLSFYFGNQLHQNPYFEAPEATQQMVQMQAMPLPAHATQQQHQPPPMISATVSVPQNPQGGFDAAPVEGIPLQTQQGSKS